MAEVAPGRPRGGPVVPRPSYRQYEVAAGVVFALGCRQPDAFAQWWKEANAATLIALADVVVADLRARADYLGTPFSQALSSWCRAAAKVANGK